QPRSEQAVDATSRQNAALPASNGIQLVASKPAKEDASDFPFAIELGEIYEGPLDLLLDLIRKQDINIYDIPIARITAQYLKYVERIRELDVNVASEFIYMAGADSYQVEDAAATRSARSGRRAGRPAQRTGQPAAGAREVQIRGANAVAETAD